MRRCHILCKSIPPIWKTKKLHMTYKQGLLSFCNPIKLMLNALIKVRMVHSCFYAGYHLSSTELPDIIHVSTAAFLHNQCALCLVWLHYFLFFFFCGNTLNTKAL